MNISGFAQDAVDRVNQMLYAEGQENPLEGQCGQKEKREQQRKPRTPAQQQADQQRAQASTGKNRVPSATRSEAARRAAETRKRCKGSSPGKTSPTTTT